MHADNDNAVAGATGIRFLSVCSGIEAASVAWGPLGWKAVAFSEIEKFPSAVLAHHYPETPNLGDFTKIDPATLGRVDILCGGTPCQAFSVAGLRNSLSDERGNLSLEFVRLAHELADGNGLRNAVWENVPGVLSTKDNAFGCFLAGLVGADSPIKPNGKWPSHGMVSGPKARAAWAVKDGQFFGVAQRRRRVLVVADFGDGADPAAVLFEPEGLPRDTPPSRETGQRVAGTITGGARSRGRYSSDDIPLTAIALLGKGNSSHDESKETYIPELARCVATREGSSQDYETTTMVAVDVAPTLRAGGNQTGGDRPYGMDVDTCDSLAVVSVTGEIAHTLQAEGADASEDGTGRGTPIVASYRVAGDGAVFDEGDRTTPLTTGTDPSANIIAFDTYNQSIDTITHTLRKGGGTGDAVPAVAWSIMPQNSGKDYKAREVEISQPLMAGGPVGGNQGGDYIMQSSAVRRLTPTECERLQGFPDNYTLIPSYAKRTPKDIEEETFRYIMRGNPGMAEKDAQRFASHPDGPRYKALGNSWAVPKFAWLGRRIQALMPTNDNSPAAKEHAA